MDASTVDMQERRVESVDRKRSRLYIAPLCYCTLCTCQRAKSQGTVADNVLPTVSSGILVCAACATQTQTAAHAIQAPQATSGLPCTNLGLAWLDSRISPTSRDERDGCVAGNLERCVVG